MCAGLLALLHEQRSPWPGQIAAALFPQDAARAKQLHGALQTDYAQRGATAGQQLAQQLGPEPAGWSQALAQKRAQLGPQVLPRGWVSATRI